ncbi:hypothetical protein [Pollutibacter soli]|uniref:hypothetical protein n=1 Tax=Pollutibacter soli TaxID=3034157 RepID=UPI003013A75C
MKVKFLVMFISFSSMFLSVYCQETLTDEVSALLKKSKQQKTSGIVCLTTGTAFVVAGVVTVGIITSKYDPDFYSYGDYSDADQAKANLGLAMGLAGLLLNYIGALQLGNSHENRKKAIRLSFEDEQYPMPEISKSEFKNYPALKLNFNLTELLKRKKH